MKQEINEIDINGTIYVPKYSVKETKSNEGLDYVMIRTYSAGVHMGYLKKRESTLAGIEVVLLDATRIYSWSGACSLSQLAMEGSKKPDDCKLAMAVSQIEIVAIEIIPVTDDSFNNLNSIKRWKS